MGLCKTGTIEIFMEKQQSRRLTVVSIAFIVFGAIFTILGILGIIFSALQIYTNGFWGKFVTLSSSIFDTTYGSLVVAGGILGLKRKKLDFCYKLGILLAVFSIIKIVMYSSHVLMGEEITYFYIVEAALSVLVPIVFVQGISHEQKRSSKVADSSTLKAPPQE